MEDFQAIYSQLSEQHKVQLPAKTTSYKQWAHRLKDYAVSEESETNVRFWTEYLKGSRIAPLPVDLRTPARSQYTRFTGYRILRARRRADPTSAGKRFPRVYNTRINEVLMTVLLQTLMEWTGSDPPTGRHGRGMAGNPYSRDVDLSRTVGWFTSQFPVLLKANGNQPGPLLKSVKEQLRLIPDKGIGYGIARYLSAAANQQLSDNPKAQISFNYLGQVDRGTDVSATVQRGGRELWPGAVPQPTKSLSVGHLRCHCRRQTALGLVLQQGCT